jgi:GT2 family glycosyltransferase/SAM-dependent methyltransferase
MTPECSIIVPVFNRASLTRQCVNLLLTERRETTSAEVVVVDDGSRDLTPRMLAGYGDRIQVVTHQGNSGFATACNDGAMVARGEFLVLLNNDTIPQRGWLDALVARARAEPRAGIIGSKLLFPNDTIQHAGVVFASNGFPLHLYYGFPAAHPAVNKRRQFKAVTGACLLIRRALFERLGGFDPAFHNVYEDVDLCLRAAEQGAEIHYCPESVLYHLQSATRSQDPDKPHDPFDGRQHNQLYFLRRWASRVKPDELDFYVEDGLLTLKPDALYPRELTVSPLVAHFDGQDARAAQADRLIVTRAKQVEELVAENIRLRMRLDEIEQQALWSPAAPAAPAHTQPSHNGGPLPLTWAQRRAGLGFFDVRAWMAALFIEGEGIEIGALHSPLAVPPTARVRYVDRMRVADLRLQYPELKHHALTEPDIVTDGERLDGIADVSQDFVIASHFLEHCQDPIGAIASMLRVTKPGGVIFLGIPDKRYTFDRQRPLTTFAHLVRDHVEGAALSREAHFEEWATLAEDETIGGRSAQELMAIDYSIHFHVWTQAEMLEFLARLKMELRFPFDVEAVLKNGMEVIAVLRKAEST